MNEFGKSMQESCCSPVAASHLTIYDPLRRGKQSTTTFLKADLDRGKGFLSLLQRNAGDATSLLQFKETTGESEFGAAVL